MEEIKGTVLNIQHFSIQDGSGIRTTVFLKGCPLRCTWCANPESQRFEQELAYIRKSCINCKSCLKNDPDGIVSVDENGCVCVNPRLAKKCNVLIYADACPAEAISVMGKQMTVDEVLERVLEDEVFYHHSYGGITISGGEPLSQPKFTEELLKRAKEKGINTAIETTGYAPYNIMKRIYKYLDQIITDIKLISDEKHIFFTGVSNELILNNFKKMREDFPDIPVLVRTPVVPGVNDNEEEIKLIYDFVSQFPNVRYELLKFHRLGEPKYEGLGRKFKHENDKVDDTLYNHLVERFSIK